MITEGETVCPWGCMVALHGEERCEHGFGLAAKDCSVPGCKEPNIIGRVELAEGMPATCERHTETLGYPAQARGDWE